ncbi:MAG: hypothetical protein JW943_07840 [Deltaproteobacteria bacterium]|nr:hypothetical protein [Deltaproteobacteria bacterium]
MWVSFEYLEEMTGRADRTIRDWRHKWGGRVRTQDGNVWLPDFFRWFENEFSGKSQNANKLDELIKMQKLKSMQFEFEVNQKKYISKGEVEAEQVDKVIELKQGLIAMIFRVSSHLSDRTGAAFSDIMNPLKKEVYGLLLAFSREGRYMPQINEKQSLSVQEKAFTSFWQQIRNLPDTRKFRKIEVIVKVPK